MRNGTYLFLCMLLLALVLGGCAGTRHSFQTTPTQEDGIVEEAGTETLSERAAADLVAMLPLEMTLIERNSFAKGMTLPEHLSSVEATTREYEIGDFGYWNAGRAEEAGNRVDKIRLAELSIDYCSACYACKKIGYCVKQDDMEAVLSKMREADVIVLATPVYFFTMCAQMKTMIDRTLGGAQKAGLENKEFYLIATAADGKAAMERTIDGLRGYLECLPEAKEMGVIYGAGAWQLGDILKEPAMQEAYQMGKNIR